MNKKKTGKILSLKKYIFKRTKTYVKSLNPQAKKEWLEKFKEKGKEKFPGIKFPDDE